LQVRGKSKGETVIGYGLWVTGSAFRVWDLELRGLGMGLGVLV
jgi:hypothetical protein